MEIAIKQYEYEKKEVSSKPFTVPETTQYFFQTFIRRSIRIEPKLTTWLVSQGKESEEIYELIVTCVYLSSECIFNHFSIRVSEIEKLYLHQSKGNSYEKKEGIVKGWIDGHFDDRTEERFMADLNKAISIVNCNQKMKSLESTNIIEYAKRFIVDRLGENISVKVEYFTDNEHLPIKLDKQFLKGDKIELSYNGVKLVLPAKVKDLDIVIFNNDDQYVKETLKLPINMYYLGIDYANVIENLFQKSIHP
jgi:hypothetical protein